MRSIERMHLRLRMTGFLGQMQAMVRPATCLRSLAEPAVWRERFLTQQWPHVRVER